MTVGPYRRLRAEELMLSNCSAREDARVPWTRRISSKPILKEINPELVNTGRTDAEAEAPIRGPPDAKS